MAFFLPVLVDRDVVDGLFAFYLQLFIIAQVLHHNVGKVLSVGVNLFLKAGDVLVLSLQNTYLTIVGYTSKGVVIHDIYAPDPARALNYRVNEVAFD